MAALNGAGVVVELADGPYVLKFTINRLINVEEELGSLAQIQGLLTNKPLTTSRYLLWEALGQDRPIEEIGTLMDGVAMKTLSDALATALTDAMGVDKEADPTKAKMAKALKTSATHSTDS